MNFKKILFGQKDLMSIGFANILGSAISSIFWFYLATLIDPNEYGQIHYFLGIAAMGQLFALIATPNAITVYVAKNIKIHSTSEFNLKSPIENGKTFKVYSLFKSKYFSKNIKLGLDLQGGSYLLLEIDNEPVIEQKLQNLTTTFRNYFKDKNIKINKNQLTTRP